MQLPEKLNSTKLGITGITLYALIDANASPWCLVILAGIYMISNAIQTIGTKDGKRAQA